MTSAVLLNPLPLPTTSPSPPPSLYAPTRLPPTIAAGLPRRAPRLRPDGLCESCVCEICICGSHHCPPTPRHLQTTEGTPPSSLTSHTRATFAALPSSAFPQRARRPVGALHTGGEWQGESSTYTTTFHPHPPSTTLPSPPITSPALFDLSLSYPRHPLPPRPNPRPPPPLTSTGAFIATSTYSSLFAPPPPSSSSSTPPPILPFHALRPPADEDREWVTEVGGQYRGVQGERRAGMRPMHAMHGTMGGEDGGEGGLGVSEARARYVKHEGARVEGTPPMDAGYEDDDGEARDMRTEAMRQYAQRVRGAGAVQVRVAPALSVGGERFEGSSVMRDSYPAHGVVPELGAGGVREEAKVQWEGGEDDRTWHTESRTHYQRKVRSPTYVRPVVRRGVGWEEGGDEGGVGAWETETRRRFVEHGDCVRRTWVPQVKGLEETPFEGGSASHEAFRGGQGGGRRELIRPVSALGLNGGGGEGGMDERGWVTESRYHYQKKEVEACPAVELEERMVKVGHGHQLYEKRVEEQKWRKMRVAGQRSTALW